MRVGILGGGQLGRMLALAGHPIGIRCVAYAQRADDPACAVGEHELGSWTDTDALDRFASRVDVATFEFENVLADAAERVAQRVPVMPSLDAIRIASDRLEEKSFFRSLGIDAAPFHAVDSEADLEAAIASTGYPAVLKTRRLGYDGKGQRVLRAPSDLAGAHASLGGVPCIVEQFVAFERELSVIAVRGRDGAIETYPLIANTHRDGILRISVAPAPGSDALEPIARDYVRKILERLDYVGVLALELFQAGDRLIANEMAPRVHNTGHLTIEGAETSQFENHLRAVAGWPLGSTALRGHSAMVNILGTFPDAKRLLAIEGAHLHGYGKAERAGRKLGHVTVCADDVRARDERLARVSAIVGE